MAQVDSSLVEDRGGLGVEPLAHHPGQLQFVHLADPDQPPVADEAFTEPGRHRRLAQAAHAVQHQALGVARVGLIGDRKGPQAPLE